MTVLWLSNGDRSGYIRSLTTLTTSLLNIKILHTISSRFLTSHVCLCAGDFIRVCFYLVTPPRTTAPSTSPLQPTSQRPSTRSLSTRSLAALGIDAVLTDTCPPSVVCPLFRSHCRKGVRCRHGDNKDILQPVTTVSTVYLTSVIQASSASKLNK